MKRFNYVFIAFLGALLLFAAWPASSFTFLIFVAFIPLLWLEANVPGRRKFFALTYLVMFLFNISTTWWIWNASPPGAVGAFLANSLLMCLPWLGFRTVRQWLGDFAGYASIIVFWMAFEFIHLQDWGLSWPWLTLGNVFAVKPQWIQWYEITGVSGGTLWVLVVNVLLFCHLRVNFERRERKSYSHLLGAIVLLVGPLLFSLAGFKQPNTLAADARNIVVVQPNIDPYEKVSEQTGSFEAQLQKLIALSEKQVDENTGVVIWPETALYTASRIDELHLKENYFLNPLWNFLRRHPQVSLFTGIESFRQMQSPTPWSEEFNGQHFEFYNGSVMLDSSGAKSFYHKSMLVPGVETLPWFLRFIDRWFEKFGGTSGGYVKQKDRTPLSSPSGYVLAPAICYESIYGEFMSRYSRNKANVIAIVTNDGWWGNTPGHKQHMNYARLRAIETRKWVARSANTGISCFIDPSGTVYNPQPYNVTGVTSLSIPKSDANTFYTRYGDWLFRLAGVLSIILICWVFVAKWRWRNKKKATSTF